MALQDAKKGRTMGDPGETARCEAVRYSDGVDCTHPAKYLVPYDNSLVCGVHARAFLRCIPIAEIEHGGFGEVS